jgi:hypothetical protein
MHPSRDLKSTVEIDGTTGKFTAVHHDSFEFQLKRTETKCTHAFLINQNAATKTKHYVYRLSVPDPWHAAVKNENNGPLPSMNDVMLLLHAAWNKLPFPKLGKEEEPVRAAVVAEPIQTATSTAAVAAAVVNPPPPPEEPLSPRSQRVHDISARLRAARVVAANAAAAPVVSDIAARLRAARDAAALVGDDDGALATAVNSPPTPDDPPSPRSQRVYDIAARLVAAFESLPPTTAAAVAK